MQVRFSVILDNVQLYILYLGTVHYSRIDSRTWCYIDYPTQV